MAICPDKFFCFNRGTVILIVMAVIIFVLFYINTNINTIQIINNKLQRNTQDLKQLSLRENKIRQTNNINRYLNPLTPPLRKDPYELNKVGIPINIHTRGYPSEYQQMGILIGNDKDSNGNKQILPLFGQETFPGSRLWNYFTKTDGYQSVKLPVSYKKKSCQGDYGCEEIMDKDEIRVGGYNKKFKANIYKLESPKYIPYII